MRLADVKGKVDFGIITIREDEFEAVLHRFPAAGRVSGRRQYNLRRVELPGGGSYLVAVLRCIEQGNGEAQSAAQDLLEDLSPQWLLVVGIAGGVPSDEFGLGDVIVSTRIHDFSVEAVLHEQGAEYALAGGPVDKDAAVLAANLPALKAELGNWSSAGPLGVERPALPTVESARSGDRLYGDANWRDKVLRALERQAGRVQPLVTAGAIASSDRLIKDTDILKVWMKVARQILALEMESAGVYRATYGRRVPTLSIRGISDLVGLKREAHWTRYACHTAAAFTLALLKTRPLEPRAANQGVPPEYADEASRKLLEQISEARKRKARLQDLGLDTSKIEQEILALRRQLREGGQLHEGDTLGDGQYLLLRLIGRGGFATVWEALDQRTDQRVAIKVLHPELARDATRRARFLRGARVMSELTHEAIVKVLVPHGHDGGFHYFVMELVSGGDFRTAVLNGKLPSEAVVPLILKVGEALELAHKRDFIHRDIKPANILLDEKGTPRLTDFDLVGGANTAGATQTEAMGTFRYAAPELMDRPQDADARADVYGLGMTALFGLYGQEFSSNILQDTEKKKLIGRLPCNAEVKKVIQRAVSWTHEKRYPHVAKFCRALEKANASVPVANGPPPPSPSLAPMGMAFEARVTWNQRDPIIKLPSLATLPERPFGELNARIPEGPVWQFRMMKEFCNVAKPVGTEDNRLPRLLRNWFGPRAGHPGTAFQVRFVSEASGWKVEPIHPEAPSPSLLKPVVALPPERIGPERGARLEPEAMMNAFGVQGTPETGRHGGFLFLCISEKGALLEPDRIGLRIGDRRPEETAFVLTSHEPRRAWRYWGVARWREDEGLWCLPKPVDHATWRDLGQGRTSSNRLPAEAENRARAWVAELLRRIPPGGFLEHDGKRCRILGSAPKGGLRIDGGQGGFKERTVSLTDLAWVLLARDEARKANEPLDETRVNRLRYLDGTPKGSTRFIDTGWALFLVGGE